MFQLGSGDRFYSTLLFNIFLALLFVVGPTAILLGIIVGRAVEYDRGGVIVDVPLGVILLFSSLAAVMAPFIYGIVVYH